LWFVAYMSATACGPLSSGNPSSDASDAPASGGPDAGPPPAALLSFEPDIIDFGELVVGAQSVAVTVTVVNRGNADSGALAVRLDGTDVDDFLLDASRCDRLPIAAGASCTVDLSFAPGSVGTKLADLSITDGETSLGPVINGLALAPGALEMDPASWAFGFADVGASSATRTFTITNTGGVASTSVAMSASHPAFVISNDQCSGTQVAAGGTCSLNVTFRPATGDVGPKVGTVVATTTGTGSASSSVGGTGQVLVSVSRGGSGAGSITSVPAGLDCGATCSARFSTTSLTLIAATSGNNSFISWGGACSGASPACALALTQSATASATFETFKQLTIAKNGNGSGTVNSSPGGITCGGTCAALFPHGTPVSLTPSAGANRVFAGWSGACSGGGGCTVSMTQVASVTATFNCITLTCPKTGQCYCP
jgi:hypothetical protein